MKLKEYRKRKHMSQRELGLKLQLADTMISKYERGVCDPSVENLIKMAEIFGVSVDALVGHNSNFLDLNSLDKLRKELIEKIANETDDNKINQLAGYVDLLFKN